MEISSGLLLNYMIVGVNKKTGKFQSIPLADSDKLSNDIGNYLRMLNTGAKATRDNFVKETGLPWSRAIYDAKRIGLDKNSMDHITRHLARMLRYARAAKHIGRITIGLSVIATTADTFDECEATDDGWICGRAVVGNAVGLAGGMLGSKAGSALGEYAIKK